MIDINRTVDGETPANHLRSCEQDLSGDVSWGVLIASQKIDRISIWKIPQDRVAKGI